MSQPPVAAARTRPIFKKRRDIYTPEQLVAIRLRGRQKNEEHNARQARERPTGSTNNVAKPRMCFLCGKWLPSGMGLKRHSPCCAEGAD